jgi:carbon storage regulator CsrA
MEIQDYITSKERTALFKPKKYPLSRFIHRLTNRNLQIKDTYGESNMLILQRNSGQSIWIDNKIQFVVLGHSKGATRIGIKAPPQFKILREEIMGKSGFK